MLAVSVDRDGHAAAPLVRFPQPCTDRRPLATVAAVSHDNRPVVPGHVGRGVDRPVVHDDHGQRERRPQIIDHRAHGRGRVQGWYDHARWTHLVTFTLLAPERKALLIAMPIASGRGR